VIWRVRDRATFQTLQRDGRRARRGPVTVVYLPATPAEVDRPARVAFAINRKVGNAVVRNKVRRRLRAALDEIDRTADGGLPAGTYLLAVRPEVTALSYRDLAERVGSGCAAVTAAVAGVGAGRRGSP
jgi:ribonuclease P protein component